MINISFIHLPIEIHVKLFDYLSYQDLVNLKKTCTTLDTYLKQYKPFILRQQADDLAKKWMNLDLLRRGFKGLFPNAHLVLNNMGLALSMYVEVGHLNHKVHKGAPAHTKSIGIKATFAHALDPNQKENFQQAIQEAKKAQRYIVNDEKKKRQIQDMLETAEKISQFICEI